WPPCHPERSASRAMRDEYAIEGSMHLLLGRDLFKYIDPSTRPHRRCAARASLRMTRLASHLNGNKKPAGLTSSRLPIDSFFQAYGFVGGAGVKSWSAFLFGMIPGTFG